MDGRSIPGRLAADWVIVTRYLRNASAAIEERLNTGDPHPRRAASGEASTLDGPPPMVIRYDALAELTTLDGANRLEQAALAVMHHMEDSVPVVLDQAERHLLERVSAGVPIAELAAELGYSRRSMFRELARLWRKLGVPDRTAGIRKAQSEGLLD
jgi:DNA-binding NarL/FixJ family response regulator